MTKIKSLLSADVLLDDVNDEGLVTLFANAKARKVINTCVQPNPPWARIRPPPGEVLNAVEKRAAATAKRYQAIELEPDYCLAAMLSNLYDSGCSVQYWCNACNSFHWMDDDGYTAMLEKVAEVESPVVH